jgi:glycosyltransferase involved in cell wall biosynthesis
MIQLSVIVASCRPQWLANCLNQFKMQSYGDLKVELIVVVEGDVKDFEAICHHHGVVPIVKGVQGRAGAFAKDIGIEKSTGKYVCFWDDDNVYYPHALATLYATASGSDLGIACTSHMHLWFKSIPRQREFRYGDIDTMCICVERGLASKVKWADHEFKGTDYVYITKLMNHNPTIRWVELSIGEKLNVNMKD